ncbi:hypothetical protein [Flavobacterium sp.]|uniref:hypothetical protein n=1 Tax=Flavobacterium sp. TaxID=239 RepID=UPI003528436B
MSIKLTDHCLLCDKRNFIIEKGTVCSINNKPPNFNDTCSKISFDSNYKKVIEDVNIDYFKCKNQKILVYIYFVVFLIFGLMIVCFSIYGTFYLTEKLKNYRGLGLVVLGIPIIIFSIGWVLIGKATGVLRTHLNDFKIYENKKELTDNVLKLYNIKYNLKITPIKSINGPKRFKTELKIKS